MSNIRQTFYVLIQNNSEKKQTSQHLDKELLKVTKSFLREDEMNNLKDTLLNMYLAFNESDYADLKDDRVDAGFFFSCVNSFFNELERFQKFNS